jgi:hypothetical protein
MMSHSRSVITKDGATRRNVVSLLNSPGWTTIPAPMIVKVAVAAFYQKPFNAANAAG